MHGNHHHQRTDLGGIISITTIAYLPLGHLCHAPPLQNPKYASDVNMPIVKQNDGTWVEKHPFLFNVYKRFFFYFCHVFLRFLAFLFFFLERFYIYGWPQAHGQKQSSDNIRRPMYSPRRFGACVHAAIG